MTVRRSESNAAVSSGVISERGLEAALSLIGAAMLAWGGRRVGQWSDWGSDSTARLLLRSHGRLAGWRHRSASSSLPTRSESP